MFNAKEREALRFGWFASLQPNAVEPQQFEMLRAFYSESEIVEIVAVISLFGFLNRWNDTLATKLEPNAADFGHEVLSPSGWSRGKH